MEDIPKIYHSVEAEKNAVDSVQFAPNLVATAHEFSGFNPGGQNQLKAEEFESFFSAWMLQNGNGGM